MTDSTCSVKHTSDAPNADHNTDPLTPRRAVRYCWPTSHRHQGRCLPPSLPPRSASLTTRIAQHAQSGAEPPPARAGHPGLSQPGRRPPSTHPHIFSRLRPARARPPPSPASPDQPRGPPATARSGLGANLAATPQPASAATAVPPPPPGPHGAGPPLHAWPFPWQPTARPPAATWRSEPAPIGRRGNLSPPAPLFHAFKMAASNGRPAPSRPGRPAPRGAVIPAVEPTSRWLARGCAS